MKQQGQKLDGDNLQEVLDSGRNASRKGRQQFFTPLAVAQALMLPMPSRAGAPLAETFVDLNMGNGALLLAANPGHAFGVDIDSRCARKPGQRSEIGDQRSDLTSDLRPPTSGPTWHCLNADLTLLYPLLQEIDWRFDLCGLNPPFSVKWHRDRLEALGDSACPAVAETFFARGQKSENGSQTSARRPLSSDSIDSTLATFLIALDRMTERGEGYMICPQSVAERIQKLPVYSHVWLWLDLPESLLFANTRPLHLVVLYFARSHHGGLSVAIAPENATAEAIARTVTPFTHQRALLRHGLSLTNGYDFAPNTGQRWEAVATEWRRRKAQRPNDWNIWLGPDGKIRRHLTPFQNFSGQIPRAKAEALNRLQDQSPMALVVQRASRIELLEAVHSAIWRVQPELVTAVERAVRQYQSHRAPFYQLNDVQRLGYLDEEDTIICKQDGLPGFQSGESYPLRSETISVEREEVRPNLLGKEEKVTLSGKELAFTITDAAGKAHKFSPVVGTRMQESVRAGHVAPEASHDLQTLIDYFRIPEVPDVAEVEPERYQSYVNQIREIEEFINDRAA